MRYEEVVVGADIGQSEFVITPEMQRDCIEALEDNNPRISEVVELKFQ